MAIDQTTARNDVAKIYIAAFNRTPDAEGLGFWVDHYVAGRLTLDQVAQQFTDSKEYKTKYPGFQTNEEYVEKIYQNVFARPSDAEGKKFWVDHLVKGTLTRGTLLKAMTDAAASAGNSDGARLNNQAEFGAYTAANGVDVATATAELGSITAEASSLQAAKDAVADFIGPKGETFTLSSEKLNIIDGTANNDRIISANDVAHTSLRNTDIIDGKAGYDVLSVISASEFNFPTQATIKNIEKLEIYSADRATAEVSAIGFNKVAVNKATDASVTAGTATDVKVSDATGDITVVGGKNVHVDASAGVGNVTVGNNQAAKGVVSVKDTNVGAGNITIKGDENTKSISLEAAKGTGKVEIEGAGKIAANLTGITGAIKVTDKKGDVVLNVGSGEASADVTMGAITAEGGDTIAITQTVDKSKEAALTATKTVTQGNVTVKAGDTTKSVKIAQAGAATAEVGAVAKAGKTETATVKFIELKKGEMVEVGSLKLTAVEDMKAEEVAAAFANLSKGKTQTIVKVTKGTYSETFNAEYTSGDANGDTVVFTATKAGDVTDLSVVGNNQKATVITVQGEDKTEAKAGKLGVKQGTVVVDENDTASLTDLMIDGFAGAKLGENKELSKLQNLTLSNSTDKAEITLKTGALKELNVTLDNVATTPNEYNAFKLNENAQASVETLNITVTGADARIDPTAEKVKHLVIKGDKHIELKEAFRGLSGLESVDASASSGGVTMEINGGKTSYKGSSGADSIKLMKDKALKKDIDLGAGDDRLEFDANVSGTTGKLSGGAGTDTLVVKQDYVKDSGLSQQQRSFYTDFERLEVSDRIEGGNYSINMNNLGFNYIILNEVEKGKKVSLKDMSSGATVAFKKQIQNDNNGDLIVQIKEAKANTSDVVNLVVEGVDINKVSAADVETVNVTALAKGDNFKLNIAADTATVINVEASKDPEYKAQAGGKIGALILGLGDESKKVTTIDASKSSSAINIDLNKEHDSAVSVTAGAGDDELKASMGDNARADVLNGGAGDDKLYIGSNGTKLTGGAGNDTFVLQAGNNKGTAEVTKASHITDFTAGDKLELKYYDNSEKVVTKFSKLQDKVGNGGDIASYANLAVKQAQKGEAVWFSLNGNSYIVIDSSNESADTFKVKEDIIVCLDGVATLDNISFNTTLGTVALV